MLGVATDGGDPLRLPDGSLLEDAVGNIAVTRLDREGLQRLTTAGGGVFTTLTADNSDISKVLQVSDAVALSASEKSGRQILQWIEYAPWFLLLLLLLGLPVFRRGLL